MDPYEIGQVSYGGKSRVFSVWIGFVLQQLEVHKYNALVKTVS